MNRKRYRKTFVAQSAALLHELVILPLSIISPLKALEQVFFVSISWGCLLNFGFQMTADIQALGHYWSPGKFASVHQNTSVPSRAMLLTLTLQMQERSCVRSALITSSKTPEIQSSKSPWPSALQKCQGLQSLQQPLDEGCSCTSWRQGIHTGHTCWWASKMVKQPIEHLWVTLSHYLSNMEIIGEVCKHQSEMLEQKMYQFSRASTFRSKRNRSHLQLCRTSEILSNPWDRPHPKIFSLVIW